MIAAATAPASIVSASSGKRGRDHRHVAQRQRFQRRDVDRAAADLGRVLRGADHGGADAFVRAARAAGPSLRRASRISCASSGAEIAEGLRLAAVDVFRHAAGERDLVDRRRGAPADRAAAGRRRRPAASRRAWPRTADPPCARRARARARAQAARRARASMPSSAAKRRPASSMRTMRPSASRQTSRAPTSSAVRSTTWPSAQTAIFDVPPPTSTFITVALSRIERATAPEP